MAADTARINPARLETRADVELFIRRAAKGMARCTEAFVALHEARIREDRGAGAVDGFFEGMDLSGRERFDRTRTMLARTAASREDDYSRDRDALSNVFRRYHETEDLVQVLADRISEDAVLGHIIGDATAKAYSEPQGLSGLTRIGYDMLYYGNLTGARAEADAQGRPLTEVLEKRKAENMDFLKDIRDCLRYGPPSRASVRCHAQRCRRR